MTNENIQRETIDKIISFLKKFNIYLLGEEIQNITNLSDNNGLKNDNNDKIKLIRTKSCGTIKINDNINFYIQNRERFFEFLKLIHSNPEAVEFAKIQKEKNAKFLLEFLVESDEKKNLQENDVQGFIKSVQFFEKILKKKT